MAAALPRTRSFQRVRPQRVWWLAVGLAVVVNLAVVLVLSMVSHLESAAPAPSLAVRRITRQPEPPLPPPPPPVVAPAPAAPRPAEAVPLALPSLELPASGPPTALTLPAVGSLDADLALPLVVPAFTPIGPPGFGDPGPAAALPAFDTPAERLGTFDLDRFYPRAARLRGLTGSTRMRLSIGADGAVSAVAVLAAQPAGAFEAAAERLARSLSYRPALRAGEPVPSVQEILIEWTVK